ncbi:sarcosine oxidase subunit delta [Kiloniella laminariae]|uniref:Sarcosine oxidase subunit delta n=1 Tax=Kiloniella laminariae TaxID=454162 RepID=A0ABT4LDZ8_9PROT|nr:sarcosine oxidase subunit delta [Kiloniella laminariae]MCZ4279320.1 sarcosine oxidase subunit delta [Kiloniella laminariae]
MLYIKCPWCGERDETEYHYGGEAHIARPENPDELTDAEWAEYVFMRTNTKGVHRERWVHSDGCRRWFNVARNTVTNEIVAVYKAGEKLDLPDATAPVKAAAKASAKSPAPSEAKKPARKTAADKKEGA